MLHKITWIKIVIVHRNQYAERVVKNLFPPPPFFFSGIRTLLHALHFFKEKAKCVKKCLRTVFLLNLHLVEDSGSQGACKQCSGTN